MKSLLCLVLIFLCNSALAQLGPQPTNAPASSVKGEPFYKGKPLSYWLDGLGPRREIGKINRVDVRQIVKDLGIPAATFILRYTYLNPTSGQVDQMATSEVIRSALAILPEEVDRIILTELKSKEAQVRVNAIESLPMSVASEAAPLLRQIKSGDPNPMVRAAAAMNMVRLKISDLKEPQ